MQIKTTVGYHLKCIGMATISLLKKKKNQIPLYCWRQCKMIQSLWKIVWRLLKKLKIKLPYDIIIPLIFFWLYTQQN